MGHGRTSALEHCGAARTPPARQGFGRFWMFLVSIFYWNMLEHSVRQPEPVTKSSVSLSMNPQIFRQELCRRGNETE